MNQNEVIIGLERNAEVFKSLLQNLSKSEYEWREAEDKWSLLEIVCHLFDEEVEDFRVRVFSVLEDPSKDLPKIDPAAWVKDRSYADQNYNEKLIGLLERRAESVRMLRDLKDPKWDNAYMHPKVGPVTANLLLVNWLAHDFLHIRQVLRVKYAYLAAKSHQNLDYAGDW